MTTIQMTGRGQARPAAAEGGGRWPLILTVLAAAILANVWRVQDLFPRLAVLSLPTVVSLVVPVVFLASPARRRFAQAVRHPVIRFGVATLILMVLAVPTSLYPGYSFNFILKDYVRTFLMMLFLACAVRGYADTVRLIFIVLTGAIIYSVVTLLTVHVGADGRLGELVYYDANGLALLIVCSIPLNIVLLRRGGTLGRLVGAGAFGLLLLTLVKTGSRGGFLGLLASGIFIVFGFTTIPKKVRMGSIAVLTALMLVVGSGSYWTMMETLLHPTQDYNWSGQAEGGRMEVWKRGIGYMMTHPLLGVGPRAFFVAEGKLSPMAALQNEGIGIKWSEAHNSFVEIGAELGVGGLLLFIGMLVAAFRTLRRVVVVSRSLGPPGRPLAEAAQALMGALVAFCVSGFFLSEAYSAFLYTLFGLIAGLSLGLPKVAAGMNGTAAPQPAPLASPLRAPGWRALRSSVHGF